jgi:5-methylcytosine-specific restriction endonuclease McrA
MSKKERTKERNRLDKEWREAICQRADNKCEYCGKSGRMNAHHIFSRSNLSVRWDLDNGICLCVGCHVFANHSFHKAPAESIEWLKLNRGEEWYDALRLKAKASIKTIGSNVL